MVFDIVNMWLSKIVLVIIEMGVMIDNILVNILVSNSFKLVWK